MLDLLRLYLFFWQQLGRSSSEGRRQQIRRPQTGPKKHERENPSAFESGSHNAFYSFDEVLSDETRMDCLVIAAARSTDEESVRVDRKGHDESHHGRSYIGPVFAVCGSSSNGQGVTMYALSDGCAPKIHTLLVASKNKSKTRVHL